MPPPMPTVNGNIKSKTTPSNIPLPPPPPLTQNGNIGIPPPPRLPGIDTSFPPALPMPSADNPWFKEKCKFLFHFFRFPTLISLFLRTAFRKKPITPPKPMRPLYWTRIIVPNQDSSESIDALTGTPDDDPVKEELWKEIDETKLDNLDEFTDLFSRQPVVPKKSKEETMKPIKIKRIKVLDCKRSQHVGIFARSLHLNFDVIANAIYKCDTSIVCLETLQRMLDLIATSDEIELIKQAVASDSSGAPLDEPERFLLKLSEISCVKSRIFGIIFQSEFDESYTHISRKNESIIALCNFLMDNHHLKKLFSIILTLGNFMNGGNRMRGQADGFGLEILGKLRDVKSKEPRITLLHYIVRTYIKRYRKENVPLNEIVYPLPDSNDIRKVITIDFDEMHSVLMELTEKLKGIP